MPKKPTPDDLQNLLAPRTEPCISLYLPLPRHGPDLAKAPVRFRALVRQAEDLLGERYDARQRKELLAPLAGLAEASDVFAPGPEGLAAFRAEGLFEVYRLWPAPPERAVVADSFHVKPLLKCLQDRHRAFVLSLGSRHVALFEGSERGLVPRLVPGLPVRVEDSSAPGPGGRGGSSRGGPRSAASGSGKALAETEGGRREEQLRFFRAVEAALRETLDGRTPLIVAGAGTLLPLFREVCSHTGLHAEFVEGAVDDVGTEKLHERTLPAARRALDARDDALVAEFRGQLDRGLAADILTRVAEAAVLGRVRRLLIADGRPLFGRVDRTTGEVTLHAGQTGPQDDDVLDDLAEIVLARGGEVVVLDPPKMPDETAAAATFRW
ncbi:MAG TPA: hypothetical protein VE129_13640 [Thermoanaerobaculia bacterium]|nr:hypothetical protein [Thermoanaerobaculia bacterium]